MSIVSYQFLISLTILLTGFFAGKKMLQVVTGGWAMWTLTHVHAPTLIFIQFGVIGFSWLVANGISNNDS